MNDIVRALRPTRGCLRLGRFELSFQLKHVPPERHIPSTGTGGSVFLDAAVYIPDSGKKQTRGYSVLYYVMLLYNKGNCSKLSSFHFLLFRSDVGNTIVSQSKHRKIR